jgi:glycosyltransferase involved in cell wall biosynthesis
LLQKRDRGLAEKTRARKYFMDDVYPESWVSRIREAKYSEGYEDHSTELLDIKPRTEVLEVGIGEGRFITRIIERGAYYTGVDISRRMIDKARIGASSNSKNVISLVVADGDHLPFRKEAFDSTLSFATMFFISNQGEAVAEIGRVTRGTAVVEFRNVLSPFGSLWEFLAHIRYLLLWRGELLRLVLRLSVARRFLAKVWDPDRVTKLSYRSQRGIVLGPFHPVSSSYVKKAFSSSGMEVTRIEGFDIKCRGKSRLGWNISITERLRPAILAKARKIGRRRIPFSSLNFAVVTHDTHLRGPSDALLDYLHKKSWSRAIVDIHFPLIHKSGIRPYANTWTQSGATRNYLFDINGPYWLLYFRDLSQSLLVILRLKKTIDVYVGTNALAVLAGLLLRKVGVVKAVIFYSIDFVPERFDNRMMNTIYHLIHRLGTRSADYLWNLSSKMVEIHHEQGANYARNLLVPIGIDRISHKGKDRSSIHPERLVFIGNLTEPKGLQLAIEALPTIIDKAPETRLTVIGTGPYGDELKRAATSHGMEDYVDFRGVMNYEDLIETLGVMGIALAPYKPDTNAMVRFTDPGKVKEYLGCGLPVIITRVPDIALEIEKRELGIVIDYDKSQFAQAVLTLMEDKDL